MSFKWPLELKLWPIAVFLLIFALPLLIKAVRIDVFIHGYTGIWLLGALQVLANDAVIYTAMASLFYLSWWSKIPQPLAIFLRLLAFVIYLVYMIDFYVIINFNTHLVLNDVLRYGSYSMKYLQQVYSSQGLFWLLFVLTILLTTSRFILSRYKLRHRFLHIGSVGSILALLLISCFTNTDTYIHSWIYKNYIDYNLTVLSGSRPYSQSFIDGFENNQSQFCRNKPSQKPNIVMLMVESLSAYQSEFFSGIQNWTPNIDEIARNNIAFKDFYANGFTTEDGEVSLLTGQIPLYPPARPSDGGSTSFSGFFDFSYSLPNVLKQQGYQTSFMTTADLQFAKTGQWAKSIGFDHVEGHEHPYYNNWERFHFKAAPDEALYHRIMDRIEQYRAGTGNYFIFSKTVSTHQPYIDPRNKEKSIAGAFNYADQQIGQFYQKLLKSGFFDDGMLVIVGDHRAMVPLQPAEGVLFGELRASAKVPAIISFGDKVQSVELGQHQQTDIFNSLKSLASTRLCHSEWAGTVLVDKPQAAKYIVHRRGDNRDRVTIFSKEQDFLIKLDGDDTRMINPNAVDVAVVKQLVNKVNAVRLAGKIKR